MYSYNFILTAANRNCDICFENYSDIIKKSIDECNNGITYLRDSKHIELVKIQDREIHLSLSCKTPLLNANRSLSALSRELIKNHGDIFQDAIYNKTLFNINLVSQHSSFEIDNNSISDTDLLKGMIDLLFTYTATNKKDADARDQTISQIKDLIKPYMQNNSKKIIGGQ